MKTHRCKARLLSLEIYLQVSQFSTFFLSSSLELFSHFPELLFPTAESQSLFLPITRIRTARERRRPWFSKTVPLVLTPQPEHLLNTVFYAVPEILSAKQSYPAPYHTRPAHLPCSSRAKKADGEVGNGSDRSILNRLPSGQF